MLAKYEGIAVNESLQINSKIEELVAVFDEAKALQYELGIDLAPRVTWKAAYRDISVRCCFSDLRTHVHYAFGIKPAVATPLYSSGCLMLAVCRNV